MMKQLLKGALAIMLTLVSYGVFAQITTGTIIGQVVDEKGESLPGVTVVAVHEPSGSVYGAATREDGRFTLQGIRTGGPYTITYTFVGYPKVVKNDVFLKLGEPFVSNIQMQDASQELSEVIIVSQRNSLINAERTGASTNISEATLTALPTLSRSITDFTRLTPQASGNSFAGADSRFNNLTIDGSIFNNSFGLADLPAGQTNSTPISLDAIGEIQINIAPYDVRQGQFTGAGINAITRSGTNEIQGSVFRNVRNQNFVGRTAFGEEVITDNFNVEQTGFRIGGPIINPTLSS